jgi:hypothetical protein
MKNYIMLFISIIILTSCSSLKTLEMSSLYSSTTHQQKDIEGDYVIKSFVLYKNISPLIADNHIITIDKIIKNNEHACFITVHYIGTEWEFIDKLAINIDGSIFSFKDNNPSREILNGGVSERIMILLDDDLVNKINIGKSLVMQYYSKYKTEPIEIPDDGLVALKEFLK